MPDTNLVISVDFDGCADTVSRRQRVIQDVLLYLRQNRAIEHITVMIGSLRQTLLIDRYNAIIHGEIDRSKFLSCKIIGEDFLEDLRVMITLNFPNRLITVEFNPLLISDIFNYLKEGSTFAALQDFFDRGNRSIHQMCIEETYLVTNRNGDQINLLGVSPDNNSDSNDEQSDDSDEEESQDSCSETTSLNDNECDITNSLEFIDCSKKSTIYTQMQAVIKGSARNAFRFYDDKFSILKGIRDFYTTHSDVIPHTMSLTCVLNDDMFCAPIHRDPILGQGKLAQNYAGILYEIGSSMSFDNVNTIEKERLLDQVIIASIKKVNVALTNHQDEEEDNEIIQILKEATTQSMNFFKSGDSILPTSQSNLGGLGYLV